MRLLSKPSKFIRTAHREGRTVERLVELCELGLWKSVEAASWSLPIADRGGWCVWPRPSCRWGGDQRAPVIAGSAEDAAEILHKTCAGDKGANLEERSGGCQTDAPVFLPEVVVVRGEKEPLNLCRACHCDIL